MPIEKAKPNDFPKMGKPCYHRKGETRMKKKPLWIALMLAGTSFLASGCFIVIPGRRTSSSSTKSSSYSSSSEEESYEISSISSQEIDDGFVISKTKIRGTYDELLRNDWYGGSDYTPASGSPKLLIIPIWFTDSSSFITSLNKEKVRSDIEASYLGSEEETGWESVKTYYQKESGGRLNLQGTVADWYECGKASTYFASDVYDRRGELVESGAERVIALVEEASDAYFSSHPSENRKDYDSDSNGKLDGVMLIYGAPDYASWGKDEYDNLWAYKHENFNAEANLASPTSGVFFWASYDFMYGGNALTRAGSRYAGGDTRFCEVDTHTYIHEMGHMFGLEDYYDYSVQFDPAGGFSMQDENVGGHDPWSNLALGWSDPYIPTESCKITLNPYQSSHDLILLTPAWNAFDCAFDEYLLLELYTPTGLNEFDVDHHYLNRYPQGPKEAGIRLWHVDARLSQYQQIDGEDTFSTEKHTNLNDGLLGPMCQNTYYLEDSQTNDYLSFLGEDYYEYDLLHLIRNDYELGNRAPLDEEFLSQADLFQDGDSFSQGNYRKQFPNGTLLDEGKTLGWEFSVSIEGEGENAVAEVTCYKV